MSSKRVFKVYVDPEEKPSAWVDITLNYVMNHTSVNKMTVSGPVGKPFKLSYYKTLGLPKGYQIDCVSDKIPSEFHHNDQVTINVLKEGSDERSVHHRSRSDDQSPKTALTPVYNDLNHNDEQISFYQDPYQDLSIMLLALGYSLGALGQAIESFRHRSSNV